MFEKKNNRKNETVIPVIRDKMNESLETIHLYSLYREIVCILINGKQKGNPILGFDKNLSSFDKPFVLDQFTDEQKELILHLKKEIGALMNIFEYF